VLITNCGKGTDVRFPKGCNSSDHLLAGHEPELGGLSDTEPDLHGDRCGVDDLR
jgi:hypothetical protein